MLLFFSQHIYIYLLLYICYHGILRQDSLVYYGHNNNKMYCIAIVLKAYSSIKCKCNLKIFHTILTEQRCETQGIMFVFETNYIVYAIW